MARTSVGGRSLVALGFAAVLFGAPQFAAHAADTVKNTPIAADPDVAITYRQDVMTIIGANAEALGAIAKGKLDREKAFGDHADMLSIAAELTYDAFGQNTYGKGKEKTTAKEKIWTDWDTFKGKLDKLNDQATKVADYAAHGNLRLAKSSLDDLFKTCKSCHDDFRNK